MVRLEAAAASASLVTTSEGNVLDWEEGGGLLVPPRVEEMTRALDQVLSWSEKELQARGQQLRQLVAQRYSWASVGRQWLKLYSEISANGK